MPEDSIEPVKSLPNLKDLQDSGKADVKVRCWCPLQSALLCRSLAQPGLKGGILCYTLSALVACSQKLLSQTAVLKLNGGLGTSMGLEKAKSLLEVKDGKTFLDLIAEQIKYTRKQFGSKARTLTAAAARRAHVHAHSVQPCAGPLRADEQLQHE